MMNFLDLRAASEEERRLIREILSDTSVVNIAEPQQFRQQKLVKHSAVPNARDSVQSENTNSSKNTSNSQPQHQQLQQQNQSCHNPKHRYPDQSPKLQSQQISGIRDHEQPQQQLHHQQHHRPGSQLRSTQTVPQSGPSTSVQLDTFNNPIDKQQPNQYQPQTQSCQNYNFPKQGQKSQQQQNPTRNHHDQQQSAHYPQQQFTPPAQAQPTLVSSSSTATPHPVQSNQSCSPPTTGPQQPTANHFSNNGSTLNNSYAIPPHVTAFGPPHHVYGGPPIFQPYPYLIPLQSYMPYVLPPNSVVPPRQQVPPQSSQIPNGVRSHSRPQHSHHIGQQQQPHHQQQQHHHHQHHHHQQHPTGQSNQPLPDADVQYPQTSNHIHTPGDENLRRKDSINRDLSNSKSTSDEKEPTEGHSLDTTAVNEIRTEKSDKPIDLSIPVEKDVVNIQESKNSPVDKFVRTTLNNKTPANSKNSSSTVNKSKNVTVRIDKVGKPNPKHEELDNSSGDKLGHNQPQRHNASNNNAINLSKSQELRTTSSANTETQVRDSIKFSSDEGFDSQSSLDISKQSHESSLQTNELSRSLRDTNDRNDDKSLVNSVNSVAPNDPEKSAWSAASSKSWADLFKRGGRASPNQLSSMDHHEQSISSVENSDEDGKSRTSTVQMAGHVTNAGTSTSTSKEQRSQDIAKCALDKMAPKLAHKVSSINLKHSLPFLKPRGFVNKGNGCYINATLQALIACPPFYNLMKEIGDMRGFRRENSCTPILDSFADLFSSFPPLESNKKNKQDSGQAQKLNISYLQAEPIEPKCIYNVLGQIKSECLKGAQEDAEEFLSSVLNGLHDEMTALGEVLQESANHNGHSSDIDSNDDVANDDNLWREVGPKNRSLPIRTAKVVNTPIQEIFGGSLFSIRTAGKDRCGHRSPFFDLQLDISGDSVKSVQDAIKSFTAPEVIHDFYCSKTRQKLDAQRRTSLDQLPPILILHLKQFVYSQDHGLKKLIKKIEYPIDFELPEVCLHEKSFSDKSIRASRAYKLLAVVYHDGKEAIKGHYLTDVYHIGSSQWIRCDDSNIAVVPAPRIENPDSFRTPYLLFYRRLNTLRAQTGNHDTNKKKG